MGYDAYHPCKSRAMSAPWSRWPHTYEKLDAWNEGWLQAESEYRESLLSASQQHVGKLKGDGDSVWHTRDSNANVYWCGSTHDRTAEELYKECMTIMGDLAVLHPELKDVSI